MTVGWVRDGRSVRVTGAAGSGKTTVLLDVMKDLEERGYRVFQVTGYFTHRDIPFSGLHPLMDARSRPGPMDVGVQTDILAGSLAAADRPVLAVDDIDFLDPLSLAVLEAVRCRIDVPLVFTTGQTTFRPPAVSAVVNHGREVQVALDPLTATQVNSLVRSILGGPIDKEALAYIHRVSAGSPRLVARLAEAAGLGRLLKKSREKLVMTGPTLWSVHLRGTVEALLSELTREEVDALQSIVLAGPATLEQLEKIIAGSVLLRLEQSGFISCLDDGDGRPRLSVVPPLIGEYFLYDPGFRGHRVLRSRISAALNGPTVIARGMEIMDGLNSGSIPAREQAYSRVLDLISGYRALNLSNPLDLTDKEVLVAGLAGYLPNEEVAGMLDISHRTVEGHVSRSLRKTGTASRHELHELVMKALRT